MTTMNGGSGGGDTNNNNNAKRPQIEDAKDFLERVKRTFEDDKTVYNQFVEIMKNFKHDHINTRHTIERVRQLFLNHPTLFEGFQNFLPAAGLVSREEIARINSMRSANGDTASNGGTGDTSYNHMNGGNGLNGHNNNNTTNNTNIIPPNNSNVLPNNPTTTSTTTDQGNAAPPDFNMAVTFICKIKQRFGSHRKIYQDFLSILQHFQTAAQEHDTSVIKDVKMRIRTLFRDHPDLLDQFDYFLPPLTAHFQRNAQSASPSSAAIGTSNNTETSNNRNGRKRPAEDDLDNQPDTKRRRRGDERSSRRRSSRADKNADSEWQPNGNTDDLSTMATAGNSSIATTDINMSTRSSSRNRKRHRDRNKSRDGSSKRHHRDRDTKSRDKKDREHRSSHHHGHHRGDDRITNDNNMSDDEEQIFFSDTDDEESGHNNYNDDEHQGLRIFSKLRKDIPDHLYRHVLTLTQLYPMGLTEFSVVGKLICDALKEHGHLELMKEFQKELQSSKQSWFFRSRGQNYYEYLTKNFLLKSCKAIQSSYRELPGDVVQPRCSGRHPDAAKVLNDYYVSKPTGGEGGGNNGNDAANSAGGRLKSQYNEALQKSEDDLFELDMMIQTNDAARKRLEQLYKTVMQPKNLKNIQNGGNMLEIPPVEKRAVSRLYSEHGTKVLNLLKKMPETTIPVVLKRLREKSLEWEQLKNEMKPVWKSVATKNYFKAHDFRWTIFKQHDNKRISFKNIVKQIEERHLSRKHLNAVAANTALLGLKKEKIKGNPKEENDDDDNNDNDDKPKDQKKMDVEDEEDEDIDLKQEIKATIQQEPENKDEDDDDDEHDDDVIKPPKLEFDPIHHSSTRRIDDCQLDCFETDIAAQHPYGLHSGYTNNGVISGVGLIGNHHDHIIQQMAAGLHVELGDYIETPLNTKVNNHDYRFVIYDKNILKDCVRFIYQFANKEEVGSEKAQKRRFVEVMDSLFTEFFKLDIKEQSIEFLENRNEEEYSPQSTNTSNSSQDSPEPISKIIQKTVKQDENELNNIDIKKCNQRLINKYKLTYFDNNKPSVEMYGNRHLYALFRYLHLLYARMNYALRLCKEENPLYKIQESPQEIQRKYKDYLSHLSKWLNEQISDEQYEDECRSLLGLKSYQLYTLNKVIQQCYKMICEIDCDQNIHPFYKLFLSMNQKKKSVENSIKHYIKASQISQNPQKGQTEELYKIEYYNQKILCISLMDKYIQSTYSQNQSPSHTQTNKDNDVKMSDNSNNRNTN